jgi:hypothetical protein
MRDPSERRSCWRCSTLDCVAGASAAPWAAGRLTSRRRGILWIPGTHVPSNMLSIARSSLRA